MILAITNDKKSNLVGKTANGVTTQYGYDGADIIKEVGPTTQADYIRTMNIDEPLTKVDGANAYHYIRDGLGSVAALVDDTGATAVTYAYDPYGRTTATGTIDNPFQFTGRENDGDLYYYRARYYSPEMQRFISRDPLQFAAGSPNFYGYVGQNPVNFTDPSGEIIQFIYFARAVVGGAAGAAGAVSAYGDSFASGQINQNQYVKLILMNSGFGAVGAVLPPSLAALAGAAASGIMTIESETMKNKCFGSTSEDKIKIASSAGFGAVFSVLDPIGGRLGKNIVGANPFVQQIKSASSRVGSYMGSAIGNYIGAHF